MLSLAKSTQKVLLSSRCVYGLQVNTRRWCFHAVICGGSVSTTIYLKRRTSECLPLPRRETRIIHEQQEESKKRQRRWSKKWRALWRVWCLGMLSTPLVSSAFFLYGLRKFYFLGKHYVAFLKLLDEIWWSLALRTVEFAGPTFIKLCQWAASRNDIFPEAMTRRFSKLHDDVKPHSMQYTAKILQNRFGNDWQERLSLNKDQILGSGCIAQVYRGKARDTCGIMRDVAVKVVHPGVREIIETDVHILRWLGNSLEEAIPSLRYLGVRQSIHNFEFLMWRQLDLRHEATNLQRLADLFQKDDTVVVPRPINLSREKNSDFDQEMIDTTTPASHIKNKRGAIVSNSTLSQSGGAFPDVLVEEFIQGRPIGTYIGAEPKIASTLAHRGAKALLRMVLQYNFIHGDLHQGNLLVTDDLKICLLDAGICIELPNEAHANMVELLRAMLESRGADAARLMLDHGRDAHDIDPSCENCFIDGISSLVEKARNQTLFESIGDYYSDICNLAISNRVALDASFISVALAVKIVEGFVTDLVPNFPILDIALPMFLKAQFDHAKADGLNRLSSYSRNILRQQASAASDARRRALRDIYTEYYQHH